MRLEELKNELPESPDFIHEMIQKELEWQGCNTNIIPMEKRSKFQWNLKRVAAAIVVCLAATSTVAYAGTKLYRMYLEKQGAYSVSTKIQGTEDGDVLSLPKKIHDISVTAQYIPKGMEWTMEGVELSYKDTPNQGGISIESVLMDQKDLNAALVDTNVVESEERVFGKYDGVYLKYAARQNEKSFNQRIYLLCPENYRVLKLYIGDDVSKEDAYKFAEGLVITEKEELIETSDLYTWSDLISPEKESGEIATTNGKVPVHKIGETFGLKDVSGEDKGGNYVYTDEIAVRVDNVRIEDDLKLLEGERIPKAWESVVGENGKLVQNHLSYVKKGDGVESLDKVVKEETVNQKLVHTTVTYTNKSDKEIRHMLYLGSLMTLDKQENGTYTVYVPEETAGDGYDYYAGDSVAKIEEMSYFSMSEDYGNGGNYIPSLKPGESVQVNMAWIVNEKDMKNMYLNLNGTGTSRELDGAVLETGLVYIGK